MRAWYRNLDFITLLMWVALVAIGLVAIYSTTHGPASEFLLLSVQKNFERQLMWAAICATGIGIALFVPVRVLQQGAYPAYVVCLGLLVAALLFGREVNGAKSWLFGVQVSELAKVGTVMAVAQLLATRKPDEKKNLRYAALAVLFLLIPAVLIILQNDTGSALIFLGLIPVMLFWSGLPLSTMMLMVSPAIVGYFAIVSRPVAIAFAIAFTGYMLWRTRDKRVALLAAVFTGGTLIAATVALDMVLQPHQLARIESFTQPEAEEYRSGVGFQLLQSKAAIGSGGVTGKGFMEGTQTQGAYIPEQSTDFIFSVIGEEFGLFGGLLMIVLFMVLLVRMIQLGARVKHPFGSMVAAGAVGIYLIHIFVNVGMVTGLLPIIGIPLPFVSYGGSALLANTAMLAIVLDLYFRRDDFSIYGY